MLADVAPEAGSVAGPGLLDATRLAMSSFDLWRDILDTNAAGVSMALDAYIEQLKGMRSDFESEFEKGGEFARRLRRFG
jgi:prephenate dehydrogenase